MAARTFRDRDLTDAHHNQGHTGGQELGTDALRKRRRQLRTSVRNCRNHLGENTRECSQQRKSMLQCTVSLRIRTEGLVDWNIRWARTS